MAKSMNTETATPERAAVQTTTNVSKSSDISNIIFGFFIVVLVLMQIIVLL